MEKHRGRDRHPPPPPPIASEGAPTPAAPDVPEPMERLLTIPLDFAETVSERATAFAERQAARAEALRIRMERFQGENREPAIAAADDDDEATVDEDEATVEEEDFDLPRPPPARRAPLTLVTVMASTALLYVGYLFLDANTRGQFTWPLRFASVVAFAGIIAAVISLT